MKFSKFHLTNHFTDTIQRQLCLLRIQMQHDFGTNEFTISLVTSYFEFLPQYSDILECHGRIYCGKCLAILWLLRATCSWVLCS